MISFNQMAFKSVQVSILNLYVKTTYLGDMFLVCLYVDDIIFMGNNQSMIEKFKKAMVLEFKMTDLGHMSYFSGLEVVQSRSKIFIHQKEYATDILKKFQMLDCNSVHTPIEVGTKLFKEGEDSMMYPTYIL